MFRVFGRAELPPGFVKGESLMASEQDNKQVEQTKGETDQQSAEKDVALEQQNPEQDAENTEPAFKKEERIRDAGATLQAVAGAGVAVDVDQKLEYGYVGSAPDGVGINDAARSDNSYGGDQDSGPNVSTQQDKR